MTGIGIRRRAMGIGATAMLAGVLVTAPLTTAQASTSTPTNVTVTDTQPLSYQGPSIASDPLAPGRLAVSYQEGAQENNCYLAISGNAGATWKDVAVFGTTGLIAFPSGYTACLRGSTMWGPDGTLYYAVTASQPAASGPHPVDIFMITSSDGGKTFQGPFPIDNSPLVHPANVGDQLPVMGVDPSTGRVYVVWQQTSGKFVTEDSVIASSTNQGRTWSNPLIFTLSQFNTGPEAISIDSTGRVYVSYFASVGTPLQRSIEVASSTNQGQTFGPTVAAISGEQVCGTGACPTGAPPSNIPPDVVAGVTPGTIYVVTHTLTSGQYQILFSVSHDFGATWSAATVLGVPAGLSSDSQFTPALSQAPNGRLDIAYYDLPPTSGLENTYLISSLNGGTTWTAPQLVSSVPSNTAIKPSGGFGNDPFTPNQLVASTDGAAYVAWTDSRRGNTATGKQDIFFAAVPRGGSGGYELAASDGGVFTFGDAHYFGSLGGIHLNQPIVAIAATPDGGGYWLVASDGGVFTLGDASFFGSLGNVHLNAPIVGIVASPDGGGYWLVASDGGVFTFGDAGFFGSLGNVHLNAPIAAIAATPDGGGYWLVASDGGVFTFGDATYFGSEGGNHLTASVVGIAVTPDGGGYWLAASNGAVFSFGDAGLFGSMSETAIVGISASPDGGGYLLVSASGGVFTFGDANAAGSLGGSHLNQPIVGVASTP